jgi:hypothetical protein
MLYATGLSESDLEKAQVGISSVWFEGNPCEATGQGLAVGKTPDGKEYDFDGLKRCVTHLKKEFVASNPDSDETSVTISANPNVPYQAVIGTMDAVRKGDDNKDLFPDVNFGLAR